MPRGRVLSTTVWLALSTLASLTPGRANAGEVMSGGTHEVQVIPDVAYREGPDTDPRKHKLDLFLPKGKRDFPVLFFIHGGAWSSGDRKLYGSLGRVFARNGIGTVVTSYRLSPQVQHPAHIEDVAKAFAWTHKNIAKHGGRPDQIFVTGQSAGGHLAALLATNEAYLKAEGLTIKAIKGAIPISGIYIFRPGRLERVIGKDPGAIESASPLKQVTGKEPPFLILYAESDFPGCGAMSHLLDDALRQKKVATACKEIPDRNHISIMVRLMLDDADPTAQELLKFVAKHSGMPLTPKPAEPRPAQIGRGPARLLRRTS